MPRAAPAAPGRRALVPFSLLSASYFAHIGFFNPYLPLWLQSLGLSLVSISLLTSVQAGTRILAPYAWGVLSDHTGDRVRLLRWCAVSALVASLGLWWQGGLVWLMLVLLVMFIHTSAMMPMSEAAMAHLVSHGGRFDAHQYGRVRLWGSLGFLVTVLVAGVWFEHYGIGHFAGWTLLTLVAVVIATCLLPHMPEEAAERAAAAHTPVWPVLRQPVVLWFFTSAFFHVLAHMAVYVFFSLLLHEQGYSKSTIGMLWALSVLVEIVWFFTQSRWLSALSLPGWLLLASAAMALRMGITATGSTWLGWLVLAQSLHALTFAAHHTACIAMLSQYFPGRLRGRGQALYSVLGYGFPGLLGALAGGAVGSHWGLPAIFACASASSVVACVCGWQVLRTTRRAATSQ